MKSSTCNHLRIDYKGYFVIKNTKIIIHFWCVIIDYSDICIDTDYKMTIQSIIIHGTPVLLQKYFFIELVFRESVNFLELNALLFSTTHNTMKIVIMQLLSEIQLNYSEAYNHFQFLMEFGNLKQFIKFAKNSAKNLSPCVIFCDSLSKFGRFNF